VAESLYGTAAKLEDKIKTRGSRQWMSISTYFLSLLRLSSMRCVASVSWLSDLALFALALLIDFRQEPLLSYA